MDNLPDYIIKLDPAMGDNEWHQDQEQKTKELFVHGVSSPIAVVTIQPAIFRMGKKQYKKAEALIRKRRKRREKFLKQEWW